MPGAAVAVEVVDVGAAQVDLQGVEDVTDSNLQSNIVEPSVTVTIGEDEPSGEKELTTEIKLENEENKTNERYF